MSYNPDDVSTWPGFKPLIIAHDVGRSRDRSTAVVGGNSPYGRQLLGIARPKNCRRICLDMRGRARWRRSIDVTITTP